MFIKLLKQVNIIWWSEIDCLRLYQIQEVYKTIQLIITDDQRCIKLYTYTQNVTMVTSTMNHNVIPYVLNE